MIRVVLAVLWTVLLAAWGCIVIALGLGTAICLFYSLYSLMRHGEFPDVSLARLFLEVYEYLLPSQYVALNTIFIYCAKLPLVVLFGLLFSATFLIDRLWRALSRWLARIFQSEDVI